MRRVFDFDCAIVRTPGTSVVEGLRDGDHAGPSHDGVLAEHNAYVAALEKAGVAVDVLAALEQFPDSMFVEDPAFVIPEGAIVLRPGAPSRRGEAAEIAAALHGRFDKVFEIADGFADGGDVLILPEEILIGLSARTDAAGARALARLLEGLGRKARIVETPPGVLHFKTAAALIDEQCVIAAPALARAEVFAAIDVIETPAGEAGAANLLRVNDRVLVGESYPRTCELLAARGLDALALPVAEVAKLDAGLSCMSLRW